MTTDYLLEIYEKSWSERPAIFGVPGGQLSPEEAAGQLIKNHGLDQARRIAAARAGEFPATWNYWYRIHSVLNTTQAV